MSEAYIYDAIRTPRGRGKANGSLHGVKPVTLVAGLYRELLARNPGVTASDIDDAILGCVTPVGDQGADIARTAVLAAGLGDSIAGQQVNRFCASGLEAINIAAQKVRAGWDELLIAGGVESMSRVPMGSDGGALGMDPETAYDAYFVPQGISADLIATIEGISRSEVDAYALESQRRAAAAWSEGRFKDAVVPVYDRNGVLLLDHDEHMRPDTTAESLAKLRPAFADLGEMGGFDAVALQKFHENERIDHVHTAGNSSGIVDGAAALLVGSAAAGERTGMRPRARIVATAVVGTDPTIMLTGPVPATEKVLAKAGLSLSDLAVVEINEAFAAIVLMWLRHNDFDPARVNVNGGAIALGHPLGATGAIITGTALAELERQDGQFGLVTLCIGAGMGLATIIERI